MRDCTPHDTPWAFDKPRPSDRISALELYATLMLFHFLAQRTHGSSIVLPTRMTLTTDNQGNSYSLTKLYSKTPPNSYILMQLAQLCHDTGHMPAVSHTKRHLNTWADDHTKGRTQAFHPERRWVVAEDHQRRYFPLLTSLLREDAAAAGPATGPRRLPAARCATAPPADQGPRALRRGRAPP